MMMPHMHQEHRKRCVTRLMGPSRMTWTKRVVFNVVGLEIPVGFMGFELLLWLQRFSYGFVQIWAKREKRRGGVWKHSGSNTKNEVRRPFIIVCSSSFHYIVRIRTQIPKERIGWIILWTHYSQWKIVIIHCPLMWEGYNGFHSNFIFSFNVYYVQFF